MTAPLIRRLILCALLVVCSTPSGGEEAAGDRVTLSPSPVWTISALWVTGPEGERELWIADVGSGSVLRYSADGSHLGSLRRPGKGSLEFDHPVSLTPSPRGPVLKQRLGKLLWIGEDLEPRRGLDLAAAELPEELSSVGLLDEAIRRSSLYGLTSLSGPERATLGFTRWQLSPLRLSEIVDELDGATKAGDLYRIQRPVMAQTPRGVYALRFAEPSFILRVSEPSGRLGVFPPGLDTLPRLPPSRGPSSTPARFSALERATVPVALYARGDHLYLLARRPEGSGTVWTLSTIDPTTDSLLGTRRLPTRAAHLTLAPGWPTWALVEKGPVVDSGRHAGPFTVLFLPADAVESLEAP